MDSNDAPLQGYKSITKTAAISRRDYFAAAALTGLLCAPEEITLRDCVRMAVETADKLIAELDKESG